MAPPSLATYQAAANAIYAPQQAADETTALSTEQNTIATDEAEKPQIQTDYTSAIDKLTQSVTDQTGSIAQLYAKNLGGNFSGLQANSMSQVYSVADEQQSIISQTEANKLAQITTDEGNAANTYSADLSSISSKYQGEEADEANSDYNTAMNDYNDQQAETERTEITQAGENARSSSTASTALPTQAETSSAIEQGLSKVTGADGYVSPQDYAAALGDWLSAGLPRADFNKQFSAYRNPANGYYNYAISQAGLG